MQFKKFTRVMAALMCGAIVAGSASVSAFAYDIKSMEINGQHCETRPIAVVPTQHGKILVDGIENGEAYTTTKITVTLLPDNGYVAQKDEKGQVVFLNSDSNWVEIKKEAENVYSFEMPWCNPDVGVSISANFITKEQAAQEEAAAAQEEAIDYGDVQVNDGRRVVKLNIAPTAHGRIEASCTEGLTEDRVFVKVIPDAGYKAAPVINNDNYKTYFSTGVDQVDWHIDEKDGYYSFKMPWIEGDEITLNATFVPAK